MYDSEDRYIPDLNREVLDLLQKSPNEFRIKTFAVEGVKLEFFNQYRNFINLNDKDLITKKSFLENGEQVLVCKNHGQKVGKMLRELPVWKKKVQALGLIL